MKNSLFLCLLSFFFGLLVGSLNLFSFHWYYCLPFLAFVFIFRRYLYLKLIILMIIFFILGLSRFMSVSTETSSLQIYWQKTGDWSMWVCSDPEPAFDKQVAMLCPISENWSSLIKQERVIAHFSLYPRINYGDNLIVRCRLEKPPVFEDLNYAAYLQAKGVSTICSWPKIVYLNKGQSGSFWYRYLFNFRRHLLDKINQSLPEPSAGLASSLLLGYKKTLYSEEIELIRRAGLSHLIVISGAHIGLFLYLFINLLIYLGLNRRQAIWPAAFVAFVYVLMTGMQASAYRALIMGFIVLYLWQSGRWQKSLKLLLLVAGIMLYHQPLLWRYDLGFQLSFSALAGMIIIQPIFMGILERRFNIIFQSKLKPIIEIFCLSLSAQLFLWPILAWQIGSISLISPLSNVFAFFIFIPLMISLFIALILTGLGFKLVLLWWPAYLFLEYILGLSRLMGSWAFSYWHLSNFSLGKALIYYLILFLFIWRFQISLARKRKDDNKNTPY